MIDLFKKELARLNNEGGVYEGYWQFRKIVERFCNNNDAYFQACMERFIEFPMEAIEEELMNSGPSDSPLLALNELLRLREAAKSEPRYWLVIYSSFVNYRRKGYDYTYGLSMALESLIPAAQHCCSNDIIPHLSSIISFCITEDFNECQEALDAIIDIVGSKRLPPDFLLYLKARVKDIRCPDGTYREVSFDGHDDELSKLQKLRQSLGLSIN